MLAAVVVLDHPGLLFHGLSCGAGRLADVAGVAELLRDVLLVLLVLAAL
jgi:hypothetical protein